jgi:hypothetical protein
MLTGRALEYAAGEMGYSWRGGGLWALRTRGTLGDAGVAALLVPALAYWLSGRASVGGAGGSLMQGL